ncbi:hypothetical protein BTUL_0126g00180 [Botrytis tulipae]|uniref:Uncharacterized protein n=1 Tax=Botrytis tulipae TaxID=87230 RepID=A0A4Z1EED3_9HELO|nr:hypothetical protein BTUL_0126g00180 [Botrytis tulipae]
MPPKLPPKAEPAAKAGPAPRAFKRKFRTGDDDSVEFEKFKQEFWDLAPDKINALLGDPEVIKSVTSKLGKRAGEEIKKALGKFEDGKWAAKVESGSPPTKKRRKSKTSATKQRTNKSEEIFIDNYLRIRVQRSGYKGDVDAFVKELLIQAENDDTFQDLSKEDLLEKIDNLPEADVTKWSLVIPYKEEDIFKEISSLRLNQYDYEDTVVARLVVLLSWTGTAITESATKAATAYLIIKMKSFRISALAPIIVRKIQAHRPLTLKLNGSKYHGILGLLTKGEAEMILTRQLLAYYYIHLEIEKDSQNEDQPVTSRKGKGGTNKNIAKGSAYLRFAIQVAGEDTWKILPDADKDQLVKKFQLFKAYGKKLSVLVDAFGVGILLSLNAQDAVEVGNLAVSKWSSAIPKALVEMARRFPDAEEFEKINGIVSSILTPTGYRRD